MGTTVAKGADGGSTGYAGDFVEEGAEKGLQGGEAGAVDDDVHFGGVPD